MRRSLALLGVVASAAAMGACEDERPTLSDPVIGNAYGFVLVPSATNNPTLSTVRFQFKRTAASTNIDSIHVTLRGFDTLTAGFYTVWIGDSTGTSFKRGTGNAFMVRTDTTFNADGAAIPAATTIQFGQTSAFRFGSPREVVQLGFTRASAGLAPSDSMNTLLVTVEADANATTPNLAGVAFFARRGEGTANAATDPIALRTNSMRMGRYVPGPQTLPADLFIPTIRGRGFFQGPLLMVNDSSMARPPVGYYYALWAIKAPLGTEPGDTVFLGDQRSPWPRRDISHFDADVSIPDPLVVLANPPSILAGSIRVSADTLGLPSDFPWKGFTEVWVTLEPKAGIRGRMGVMRIATAFAPGVINLGQRQ
jgi:hypothetical protein